MKIMFQMMNEARLDVGVQGMSIASAAYEHAVQYAKERIQSKSALAVIRTRMRWPSSTIPRCDGCCCG